MLNTKLVRDLVKTTFNIEKSDYSRLDVYQISNGKYNVKITHPSEKLKKYGVSSSLITGEPSTKPLLEVIELTHKQKTMWMKIKNSQIVVNDLQITKALSSRYATINWRDKLLHDLGINKEHFSGFATDKIYNGTTLRLRNYTGPSIDVLRKSLVEKYPNINSAVTLNSRGTISISQYTGESRTQPNSRLGFDSIILEFIKYDLSLKKHPRKTQELKNGFTTTIVGATVDAKTIVNLATKSKRFDGYDISGYEKPTGIVLNFRKI